MGLVVQVAGTVVTLVAIVAAPLILMYSRINTLEVELSEVETQFKAADDYRNINLAAQMRFNSLLWQQAFGQPFPSEVYFPSISNRK